MIIELVVPLLIFAISLVVLASASHSNIKSIEELIALTGLSEASAGFVILAVMTSTPEIIVALFSVLQGTPGISIVDILGSNVFNVGAVLERAQRGSYNLPIFKRTLESCRAQICVRNFVRFFPQFEHMFDL